MGYTEDLVKLLRPLGVYTFREGSFSLGELQAMGLGLAGVESLLDDGRLEASVLTASEEGLKKWEALMGFIPVAETLEDRRRAAAAMLRIGQGSFTPAAIADTLAGCGVDVAVVEEGPNRVGIRFPGLRGIPTGVEQMKVIIERILPCHLEIGYRYAWLIWDELEAFTWDFAEGFTWDELSVYNPNN